MLLYSWSIPKRLFNQQLRSSESATTKKYTFSMHFSGPLPFLSSQLSAIAWYDDAIEKKNWVSFYQIFDCILNCINWIYTKLCIKLYSVKIGLFSARKRYDEMNGISRVNRGINISDMKDRNYMQPVTFDKKWLILVVFLDSNRKWLDSYWLTGQLQQYQYDD